MDSGYLYSQLSEFGCLMLDVFSFQVGSNNFIPVHRFILACRSEYFRQLFTANTDKKDHEEENQDLNPPTIEIDNVNLEIFMQFLTYIYTDTCTFLTIGAKVDSDRTSSNKKEDLDNNMDLIPRGTNISAYAHHKKKKKEAKPTKKETEETRNPLKKLQEVAKRFGVKQLVKKLDSVRLRDGYVQLVSGKSIARSQPRFDHSKHAKLCDVIIKSSVDNSTMAAHKCILVARLEYFHSMLASGWIEVSVDII